LDGVAVTASLLGERTSAKYLRRKTSTACAYFQIVTSRRTGDQVRQQVIATLGYEDLQASGQLERRLRSGARLSQE
jgi:hypothetical protein